MGAAAASVGRLLVIGELCVDLIIETGDEIRFGQHEQIVPRTTLTMGSSSAITACGAAALGIDTRLISVRGDDTFGRFLDEELRRRAVDTSGVRIDGSLPTGASTHLTRPDGDRAILTSMGSIGTVRAADVTTADLTDASHLHIGSYFLQHALQDNAPAMFAAARAAGVRTSLDGNFDPAERWDSGIRALLPHVDAFFGNEEELTGIAGVAGMDDAVRELLGIMPRGAVVVAKLGADGAYAARLSDGEVERVRVAVPPLDGELVDTVGAGDTLAAGFIAGMLHGMPVEDSLRLAVACGTASTRGSGGVGAQPDWEAATALAARTAVMP
ncbi:carbohydrate kinase family protein [Microbacterium hydrocarbonoxydans]|uniref:carbohydrate kinase family protein n=1 Tax=Microbacterium hydrocarbonoxydans TaxID=273678 RepID=UPI00203C4B83|nr:carbohydrate kinase family protein [Microbacterium hydrocarbonoxydans]MCM3778277.1 carbohydrate kinase family protein [Microbacterium hydrocarbonoxydans]